ncbi:hypothetical protein T12_10756, partial [Trichinella patagoniensis]
LDVEMWHRRQRLEQQNQLLVNKFRIPLPKSAVQKRKAVSDQQ